MVRDKILIRFLSWFFVTNFLSVYVDFNFVKRKIMKKTLKIISNYLNKIGDKNMTSYKI
jgi:hypothetical protein